MWNTHEFMTADFRKALPWFVFVIGFIGIVLIAFVIFWLFRISRKSHLLERLKHHS
jgi:hypothetical protein